MIIGHFVGRCSYGREVGASEPSEIDNATEVCFCDFVKRLKFRFGSIVHLFDVFPFVSETESQATRDEIGVALAQKFTTAFFPTTPQPISHVAILFADFAANARPRFAGL